ncbi:MAG: VOC family protein [Gammaproteobacteria bacterium]|nr:VOC family protein [Gammaproteobacteria bacterium]
MIELAKPAVDVGLFTNRRDPMLAFWQQEAGVVFAELLPLGGGLQQHRHHIGHSILKINHSREPLQAAPAGGIRRLRIARSGLSAAQDLNDPDGNRLRLEPPGEVSQIRVELTVSRLAEHQDFYGHALGLPALDEHTFLCGDSQIHLQEGDAAADPEQRAPGFRYLTVQVFDVRATHAGILARGGREGRPPVKLGDVAHISFVRDPDGNWIEVSQRKTITGSLD